MASCIKSSQPNIYLIVLTKFYYLSLVILGWVKSFAIFWNILVCGVYIWWSKQFKPWKILTVVVSIMVDAALTYSALLYFMYDLKIAQMNIQYTLIQELILYKFKIGHNALEATKNICCGKDEGTVDHSTVTRWYKKFCWGWKNFDDQARSGKAQTVDFKTILQAIEANLPSSTQRIWDEFNISQSHVSPWQKYLDLANCASCHQNIAKLLIHLSSSYIFL